MAPQNSTLLHENFELSSEISRYSPILPFKEENTNGCGHNSNDDSSSSATGYAVDGDFVRGKKSIYTGNATTVNVQQEDEIPIWICGEPRFISGITCSTTCDQLIQALIDDELCNNACDVGNGDACTQLNKHPAKNDFAVAMASRDLNYYVITERWRDVEQALTGTTHILPIWQAWGSARNEVKFKLKINRNKAGHHRGGGGVDDDDNDDVENDIMFDYKKGKERSQNHKSNKMHKLTNMMRRLVRQSETIHDHLSHISKQKRQKHQRKSVCTGKTILLDSILTNTTTASEPRPIHNIFVNLYKDIDRPDPMTVRDSDDELFLLIDDNGGSSRNLSDCVDANNDDDDQDSGVHVEYRQHVLAKKCNLAQQLLPKKLQETPKRNKGGRSKANYNHLRDNNLNRKLFAPIQQRALPIARSLAVLDVVADQFPRNLPELQQSSQRHDVIQYEIAKRMVDMSQLLQYEEDVTLALTKKCAQYRAQNERYHAPSGRLELCVDRVQAKLQQYAKDIVENELELFKIKMEITQKCGVLHNLQRMLRIENVAALPKAGETTYEDSVAAATLECTIRSAAANDVNFVDNIYEFCDNNRSIVV